MDVGVDVVLQTLMKKDCKNTINSFKESGGNALGVPMDVPDAKQVLALAQKTLDHFGAFHVLCNNADFGYAARCGWETLIEGWGWVLDVNLMGIVLGIQIFMPIML